MVTRRKKKKHTECPHNRIRSYCKECDFLGYLTQLNRITVNRALGFSKTKHPLEYLGCDMETYKTYLESKFKPGMTWKNYGEKWQIDHIIPLRYRKDGIEPVLDDVIERLYYLNTQPLWSVENMAKSNKFIG
jgi:hypothetical protein